MKRTYTFKARVWLYPGQDRSTSSGQAAWHFVTLPQKTALDIDDFFAHQKRGFGSLPVIVTVGLTSWKTSIFPDKKEQSYILPLKAEVRKKEGINQGDTILFNLKLGET